tara:strand:+ start:29228 stop:29533 length:306 start_codon:yes stop_codon:yes gene_type:complete
MSNEISDIDIIFGHKQKEIPNVDLIDVSVDNNYQGQKEKELKLIFTEAQLKIIKAKLESVQKENGLNSMSEALIKVLEPYRSNKGHLLIRKKNIPKDNDER